MGKLNLCTLCFRPIEMTEALRRISHQKENVITLLNDHRWGESEKERAMRRIYI